MSTAACWPEFSISCHTRAVLQSGQGTPEMAPTPSSSLYLNFVEEFSIQEGQLLGYFVAVEIMQGPWSVGRK